LSLPSVLFPAEDIAARLEALCETLAALPERPQVMAPVLVGAFVFAADLLRGLARRGLDLETEMLWLRSYGAGRSAGSLSVLAAPGETVRGKHVLLIDTVLDKGHTLARASELLRWAGATTIRTVVAVDKLLPEALLRADHALYTGVRDFIVGYGTDDAGRHRGLPYIGKVEV
jgi:hypoxanthine phosphoribosyltransferase